MMKNILKVVAILVVVTLIVIQFFRIDTTNPGVNTTETLENVLNVPETVRTILDRSCADCHSHKTTYPWYADVQPMGWFLKNHIDEGRRKINLSVFGTYPLKKQARKIEEMCEQVEKKEMPLPSYLWIHREAALNTDEIKLLCDWATGEKERLDAQIATEPTN